MPFETFTTPQPRAPFSALGKAGRNPPNVVPPPPGLPNSLEKALATVLPHMPDAERSAWMEALKGLLPGAGVIPQRCVAAFLGQCAFESGGFRILEEDLCYHALRLCEVWPNRFPTLEAAEPFAMQPEALANQVYADRMGNGGPESGDGWKFRGRGLIQLTGRTLYQRFADAMKMDLDAVVDHAATREGAIRSATWFWSIKGLNEVAERWSIDVITWRINGGLEGAEERSRLCEAALQALNA